MQAIILLKLIHSCKTNVWRTNILMKVNPFQTLSQTILFDLLIGLLSTITPDQSGSGSNVNEGITPHFHGTSSLAAV